MSITLHRLQQTIKARRGQDPSQSYVAKLLDRGTDKIAQKVGEEATETVIAAIRADKAALTSEAADLIFHLLILLEDAGLSIADVEAELDRRDGVSGIAEKAARKDR
jgi:phosphoribosyl-ATP pyrophosphohydrolase